MHDNTLYYFSESTLVSEVRHHSELTSRPSLSTAAPAKARDGGDERGGDDEETAETTRFTKITKRRFDENEQRRPGSQISDRAARTTTRAGYA
jgi:hypothetical protein